MIADEDNERALGPTHVGERVAFSIHTLEREVGRFPAEVANALFGRRHYKPSAPVTNSLARSRLRNKEGTRHGYYFPAKAPTTAFRLAA